jgi:hypothetical protein
MSGTPPAGWFDDPTGRCDRRWWDGTQWTLSVQVADTQFVDPLEATEPPGSHAGSGSCADLCGAAMTNVGADGGIVLLRRAKLALIDLYPSWSLHSPDGSPVGTARFVTVPADGNARQVRVWDPRGTELVTVQADGYRFGVTISTGGVRRGEIVRHRSVHYAVTLDGVDCGSVSTTPGWGRVDLAGPDGTVVSSTHRVSRKVTKQAKHTGDWFPERVMTGAASLAALAVTMATDPFLIEIMHDQ